jgi:hypothetical protein
LHFVKELAAKRVEVCGAVALDGALLMNIFMSTRAPQAAEHLAAAERLSAIVSRCRVEPSFHPSFEEPLLEAQQRHFLDAGGATGEQQQ